MRSFAPAARLLFASLSLAILLAADAAAQTCTGGQVDLKACGAAGDDVADDSPAFQAALDALAAAGGGTLDVPEGRYRLASPVSKNFLGVAASVIIRGHGSSSVIRFASGPGTTNVNLAGAESLLVENLVFAGTPGVPADARTAFFVRGTEKATFRRTDWYGIAATEVSGAVLRADQTDLLVENSSFRGCGGHASNLVPVVRVTDWYSTKFTDTDFIDYGTLHGTFHSKTPQGVFAWIHLATPLAEKEGRAIFSRMFFDEGANIGVISETARPNIIHFEHIGMNVNSTDAGVGIKITGARHASIKHSYLGYASATPRNAIEFFNVGTAVVEQTELRDQANRILVDSLTRSLTISDSTVATLDADAQTITLRDSNITTLELSPSSRVTTRTGGRLTADGLALGGGPELTTTDQTGTGNLVLANSPTITGAILTTPTITGASLTNASFVTPHLGAATGLSLALGGGTPLTTTNRTGAGNLVLATSPTITGATLTTPTITNPTITGLTLTSSNIGTATATSLSIGGGTALTTTNRTGTGNLVLATSPTINGATLTSPTISGATLTTPTITGASLTNATLVTPNLGAATGLSLALGGGTPLTTTNRTGTGNLVLANAPAIASPVLTTPTLGAAVGTSLALGGGTPLTTTNQTGTGSLVLANSPTLANATLTTPTITGASLTNASLVTPNLGAATGLSLALGGGTPLTTTNRTGTGNLVLATSPTITGATLTTPTITGASLTNATLVTPNLGAATGLSLALGGGTPLTTTNRTGTGNLVLAEAPTLANATLTSPVISNATITGAALSGVTLMNPNLGAAAGLSLALGGGTPLATTNQTGTGSLVMSNSPTLVAPNLGAARATSVSVGGGTPLTTTDQTGTGSLVLADSPLLNAPTVAGRVARTVLQLAPGVADPSVAGGDVFQVSNAAPVTLTDLRDGAEGQMLILVFADANTTVADNGPDIRLRGDFASKPDAVLILIRVGAAWYEISRSIDAKPFAPPKTTGAPAVVLPAPAEKPADKSDKRDAKSDSGAKTRN